ncbi:purine-nucleoside phosphorylase [Lacticaseibacillus paracasei]|uniref:purine-nucleoside phosphorylase n=1 Tax=Lacticaseibacillus paracasei TaxID=1597 RepID=UPI0007BFC6DA|nr:purine-nucleoside phosphorylase [Lacticaseibacillus paracasei]URW91241.1 purine-nucleoside phosphorylase [Lacticaseibacillus paracasei]
MSIHIAANKGDIAEKVLLPGDPLRAKFIAENFLENVKQYTSIRNAFGFTGYYRGEPISIQSTGMGIPSFLIYSTELIETYNVKTLIRIGTVGSLQKNVKIRDLILVQGSSTDSSIINNIFGSGINFSLISNFKMLRQAARICEEHNFDYHVGNVLGEDRYYNEEIDHKKLASYEVLGTEMETPALYTVASKYHRQALSILTVSNSLLTGEETTSEDRRKTLTNMVKVALETAHSL